MPSQGGVTKPTAIKTLWVAVVVIVADQLSKMWVLQHFQGDMAHAVVPVLPHLNIILAFNEGAAFSFLSDMGGAQRWLFSGLAVVVSMALIFWLKKLPARWSCEVLGINFILGGAIGNVIDRLLSGRVTDFIDVYWGSWHYATFNVADIAISVGAFCLILHEFWLKPRVEKQRPSGTSNSPQA